MSEKKKFGFDRRRFLSNSAKLVAGATAAVGVPHELFATQDTNDRAVLDERLVQTEVDNCEADFEFDNWDYTLHCEPKLYCQPRSDQEVVDLVQRTYNRRGIIRTFGAGHSWSPVVLTSDTLINLDKLKRLITVDKDNKRATIQAGARIKHVVNVLRKNQLGLKNLGSIKEQSIAGVISTATHGTGLTFGSLPTQVIAMKLVTGRGELLSISEEQNTELMAAARTSLGALGIITEATIQGREDYNLKYQASYQPFDTVLDQLSELVTKRERVRLYWHTLNKNRIKVMTMDPTDQPATPESELVETIDVKTDDVYHLGYWPGLILKVETNKRGQVERQFLWRDKTGVRPYDKALTIPMPPLHQESEYAIPWERASEAVRLVRRLIEQNHLKGFILVEVRFVEADNIMLSPSYKRRVCYIGGYIFSNLHANAFFRLFEPEMKKLDGRPHWGKRLTLNTKEAHKMYPLFKRFNEIRKDLDPRGIFENDFIRTLFNG